MSGPSDPGTRTSKFEYWGEAADPLLATLATTASGLTESEAARRLNRGGANRMGGGEHPLAAMLGLIPLPFGIVAAPLAVVLVHAAATEAAMLRLHPAKPRPGPRRAGAG